MHRHLALYLAARGQLPRGGSGYVFSMSFRIAGWHGHTLLPAAAGRLWPCMVTRDGKHGHATARDRATHDQDIRRPAAHQSSS